MPDQLNILIAGKNGNLVDTMIFANINPKTRKITLISIPRDLYYNSRKVNSLYSIFGINELKRTLSLITGYKIEKHILIDMYAFIEVIDLLGGIDIHLDKPVIDPTYKTFDAGEWSTLFMRAGDHHLNGKQALRLARSRHTSSDFARAERQQLILKALQAKAQKLQFGDAGTLKKLAETILSKTETDINFADALAYYFRFQNFNIDSGHVLSSGNVLESKHTGELNGPKPCPKTESSESFEESESHAPTTCKQDKGQFILTPRGNNWNIVKWYVSKILTEQ